MKKIALALTAVAAMTTAASAMTESGLTTAAEIEVLSALPGADLSNLSADQITALEGVVNGEDSGLGAKVRAILN